MRTEKVGRLKILKMEIGFLKARVRALRSLVRCLPGGKEALAEWSRQDKLEKEEMKKRTNKVIWESLQGFMLPSKRGEEKSE